MRVIVLQCLAFAVAGQPASATPKQPLVTTDILFGTYDMFGDLMSIVWEKAQVDKIMEQVPKDQIMNEVDKQMKALPPPVTKALRDAQVMWVQIKDAAGRAAAPASEVAVRLITEFEKFAPAYQGLIRKTPGDLFVFIAYICIVVYLALKVVLFALRTIFSIFYGICCCGMCRRRVPTNGKSHHKAKGNGEMNSDASLKGKAAMTKAPANAASKPASNKKK